ncbi:acyl carrier protein [Alkalihalophilus lindianensis]|uniref:Acyl carrier protein n=1 Tax=Alkalihalophilus lindianensis TaxID=1630542 RepID=A0ABU3X802_9BACI|nr:acyl carrier protein [Alkalihalophilus lindianensis]MDV2684026.1 acyl carrier protein [Alkalihalophilus lindianensis]
MSDEFILEKIRTIITSYTPLKPEDIKMDSHLTDELGLDSADLLELVMTAEEQFGINIDDSIFEEVKTIKHIVDTIKESKIVN